MAVFTLGSMPPRSLEPERMDAPVLDHDELVDGLDKIEQANRWLGGWRSLKAHLEPLVNTSPNATLLDVGTGNARAPALIRGWAEARGCRWSVVGLELHPQSLAIAAASNDSVPLVRGDGLAVPFPDRAFDAVFCVLMIHHLDDGQAVTLVREMARVSRGLVLVNDLERARLNYLGSRALGATLWRNSPLARYDGPTSVRRSFTAGELLAIGHEAGLEQASVRRHFFYRLTLSGQAPGAAGARS